MENGSSAAKRPPTERDGRMAPVLHRGTNGEWKVQREMWNAAPNLESRARNRDKLEVPASDGVGEVFGVFVLAEGLSRHDTIDIAPA